MSSLRKENLNAEEEGLFKDLAFRAALNNGGNIPKDVSDNISAMRAVVTNIPTAAGRKYALSKLLNNPKYGFDKDIYMNDSKYSDAWSLKNQDDYIAPDIKKAEEKLDKEEFFNWDSNRHWSKIGTQELNRKAQKAGYSDLPAYLKDVGDIQTQMDTDKELNKYGYGIYGKTFTPRMYEAYRRREDPTLKEVGLDMAENALYALNPVGRGTQAALQGSKIAAKAGLASDIVNAVANPLIMEAADAITTDDPNNDRSNLSMPDIALGAAINAGMTKVVPRVKSRSLYSVPESNAQKAKKAINQAAKDAMPTYDNRTINVEGSELTRREANDKAKFLKNEIRRREVKNLSTEDLRLKLDKINMAKKQESAAAKEAKNEIKNEATTFGERLKSDITAKSLLGDYASNKTGDWVSEDPNMTKKVINAGLRNPVVSPAAKLLDIYYKSKEDESEKDKLNRLYNVEFN